MLPAHKPWQHSAPSSKSVFGKDGVASPDVWSSAHPPKPAGIPASYVIKPFAVKLDYEGRPWCTVPFELGHNEIGDADDPEFALAPSIIEMPTAEPGAGNVRRPPDRPETPRVNHPRQ
jgi:hypothetical protein